MSCKRRIFLFVVGALLTSQLVLPATAQAEPLGPLHNLVDVAAQRLATADPVAAFKWIDGGPITAPHRDGQVPDAVADVLRERRLRADRFGLVDEIALQWNSLHSPSCETDLAGAIDAVAAERRLDGLHRQALSTATRSYCGIRP